MKRYLIIKYWLQDEKDVLETDQIEKKQLLELKDNSITAIVDTERGEYFDVDTNQWEGIGEFEN